MNNTGARDALIEQIKKSDNILVALSANPTIDELTAALGLTLILNKTNDHVTTIFSGEVPSVLNFLEPNKFFDKTVDGLRDFIIALNPDKADRVRTKVVDGMVRVSITPSKGAVTVDDLEFSQGDYNVDLVIALGVKNQADLDKALEAHGRILHSAFVASIGVGSAMTDLGNLNWQEPALQSYAQIVADLSLNLDPKLDENGQPVDTVLIDSSVATALMTGLVSITERFSNNLTTPEIMSLAAVLMGQGANQQLIAKELDEPNKIAALKQSLNQQNKIESAPEAQTPEAQPDNLTSKLEHEAVIDHPKLHQQTVEKATNNAKTKTETQYTDSESGEAESPVETGRGIYGGAKAASDGQTKSNADLRQMIAEMVQTPEVSVTHPATNHAQEIEMEPEAETDETEVLDTPGEATLPEVQPPIVEPVVTDTVEPTLGEMTAPVSVSENADRNSGFKQTTVKDESWEKVNQFKQAFLDKMNQGKQQAEQVRQAGLDQIKQAEPPEPPKADKPPIEVVEPVVTLPQQTPEIAQPVNEPELIINKPVAANNVEELANELIESPRQPRASVAANPDTDQSAGAAKFLTKQVKKLKTGLKRRPSKVVQPLEKPANAGPTIQERIEQELSPVAPPVPPMPSGLDLPPPLPPMPPAIDQLTMTSLPPVETGLYNNPFDALETPVAPPTPPAIPTPPPAPQSTSTPVSSVPQSIPTSVPTSNTAPAPLPNLDAQLTPQEAKAIGLTPPAPAQPKQPVPENQFVIPE